MRLEIESICFEKLGLMLYVWRPTGTAAGEANGVWGGGVIRFGPSLLSISFALHLYSQGQSPRRNFALRENGWQSNQSKSHYLPNEALIGG